MTMAVLGQSQPLMYGQQIMQMPDGSFTQTVAYGTVAAAPNSNNPNTDVDSPTPTLQLQQTGASSLEDLQQQQHSGPVDLNASISSMDDPTADEQMNSRYFLQKGLKT